MLKNTGPSGCKKAVASPVGNALGEVTFGSERVPEEAKLQAFFGSNKGLLFYVQGSSPVSLEFVSQGTYVNSGQAPYGLELKSTVPAIATVPAQRWPRPKRSTSRSAQRSKRARS